jgi:CBS domain-containing protein
MGMLSERDALGALGPEGTAHAPTARALQRTVDSLMTPNVVAAERDTAVVDLIDTMVATKVGALPIIDDRRLVVGIVSYIDLLRALRPLVSEGP